MRVPPALGLGQPFLQVRGFLPWEQYLENTAWGYVNSRLLGFGSLWTLSARADAVSVHRCSHPSVTLQGLLTALYVVLVALHETQVLTDSYSFTFCVYPVAVVIGYKLIFIFICLYSCHVHFPSFMT